MNRREFIGGAALAALGTGCTTVTCSRGEGTAGRAKFHLGIAGITFAKFKLDEALKEMERLDVRRLCVKSFHLPFDATSGQIAEFKRKLADRGVTAYGAGPIAIRGEDDLKRKFDYVAALGVPVMVGVPWKPDEQGRTDWVHQCSDRALCEKASRLADEYKLLFAIHNHGKDPVYGAPGLYPTPAYNYELVKNLSPRMGLCLDVAYTFTDGFDPAETIRRYADRIFDVHLRNVSDPKNGSSGAAAHAGKIDYVRVFRALADVGYDKTCGLELYAAYCPPNKANPGADPYWIPASLGYFRGICEQI